MARRRIGVFDSGVGGLTVFRELRAQLPDADLVYLGDTARTPYGTKGRETIIRYALECSEFLMGQGVSELVVACNTVSSYALPAICERFPTIPVYGTIAPAVAAALSIHRRVPDTKILVLGTKATVSSGAFPQTLAEFGLESAETTVLQQACPLFVPLVEEGLLEEPVTEAVLRHYLLPYLPSGESRSVARGSVANGPVDDGSAHQAIAPIGVVILGCTHYPVLRPQLNRLFGPNIALVDCASSLAAAVLRGSPESRGAIQEKSAPANFALDTASPHHRFFCTDDPVAFTKLAHIILQEPVQTAQLSDLAA